MLRSKYTALAATLAAGLLISGTGLAYHGLRADRAPVNTAKFRTATNSVQIKRVHLLTSLPSHLHQQQTLFDQQGVWVRVNKAHLVFFDAKHRHVKEMIIDTTDGQRIAVLCKPQLRRLIKDNPQWLANNNLGFLNKNDNLYYVNVNTLTQVWLGQKHDQIVSIAIPAKPVEMQK